MDHNCSVHLKYPDHVLGQVSSNIHLQCLHQNLVPAIHVSILLPWPRAWRSCRQQSLRGQAPPLLAAQKLCSSRGERLTTTNYQVAGIIKGNWMLPVNICFHMFSLSFRRNVWHSLGVSMFCRAYFNITVSVARCLRVFDQHEVLLWRSNEDLMIPSVICVSNCLKKKKHKEIQQKIQRKKNKNKTLKKHDSGDFGVNSHLVTWCQLRFQLLAKVLAAAQMAKSLAVVEVSRPWKGRARWRWLAVHRGWWSPQWSTMELQSWKSATAGWC